MKNILIATPMMPPTPGGPATHAKKLFDYFANPLARRGGNINLFNFEKYIKYPSGIRHLLCLLEFISPFPKGGGFLGKDLILALDGFTIALPAVIAGIILRKKVILRIGGDFIYEEFLNTKEITFEEFYNNFAKYKKLMSWKLYIKYLVQKFVLENCYGIIFNTSWQKNIYEKHYSLPHSFVIQNPVEPIVTKIYENEIYENSYKYIFTSITRDIIYKNQKRVSIAFAKAFTENQDIYLETQQGSWESCLKKISMSRAYICASISDISPNQVQEALSLKIPVIISKHTGITKILQDAGVARVVDPFDIEDIKNAILEMCDDNIWNNYKKNLENFKWEQSWESLFKQYEEILNHH